MFESFRTMRRRHSLDEHDPQAHRVLAMSLAAVEYRLSIMPHQPFPPADIPTQARRFQALAHQIATGRISDQEQTP